MMQSQHVLILEDDQVDYLIDYLRTDAPDDPYLEEIAYSLHEQAYR